MSDLSWLNPTPHTIAVYASSPLSPATTQHSLPSGRYSLLGPDFHRLDRTSLRLAHLLDHLVGEHLDRVRHLNAECPRRLRVDDELEFGGLQNREVGGLRALEDSTDVDADLMPRLQTIGPITHQPSDLGMFTIGIDRGNPIARRERRQLHAPADEEAITGDIEGVGRVAPKAGEGGLDFAAGACVEHSNL